MAIKPFVLFFSRISFVQLILFQSASLAVQAAPLLFSDEAAFTTASASTDVYLDFEDHTPFGERVGGGVSHYALEGFELSAPLPAIKLLSRNYSGARNTTYNGRNYLSIDTDLRRRGTVSHFDFASPLQSIGFYLIDHDASDTVITVNGIQYLMPEVDDGEVVFFGLLFDEISSLPAVMRIDSGQDAQIAIDDLRFSYWPAANVQTKPVTVDEPNGLILVLATGLLMSLGFAGHGRRAGSLVLHTT